MYLVIRVGGYLLFDANENKGNDIKEFAHLLTGYAFEDNDDILNKKECDHIDRFPWNNKSANIMWSTAVENIDNQK
jgi:hypothetical protein